jgi:hypothetical protein
MKHINIKENKSESCYKPIKLEQLSYKIKERLEKKKHTSLFEKIKKSIFG